jgi:pyruvate carboxylase
MVVTEALMMETTIKASFDGKIDKVYAKAGSTMESQDLLIQMSPLS